MSSSVPRFWRSCLLATIAAVACNHALGGTTIPAVFEAGHIYATPRLANGKTLRLLVDTGGGGAWTYWLWRTPSLDLAKLESCRIGGQSIELFRAPAFSGTPLPPPVGPCRGIMLLPKDAHQASNYDGMIGANYLATHGIWAFDYPGQRLIHENKQWTPPPDAHQAPLGFTATASKLRLGFPRLTIVVDGEPLDMLLDTGATGRPTASTLAATGEPVIDGQGVTSYVTTSMLERWHRRHPDWKVINNGDDLFGPTRATRVIRVPDVVWAGMQLGPVWFTERPDDNFHVMMAAMMDKRPEGALGGNVFRHMVLTIDYLHERAWVVCKDASFCRSAAGS